MFVVANLILTVADLLSLVINVYTFVIIVAAFLSWVNPDPYNPIVRTLRSMTEPVFARIRKHISFVVFNGVDLSPVVALILLQLLSGVVVQSLRELAPRVTSI